MSIVAAGKLIFVAPCRPQAPFTVVKTPGLVRTNSFCSSGDSFTIAAVLVGISERCENPSTNTKIGMMHVRRFNRFRKTQRQFTKFIWRHAVEDLLSSSSCSVQRHLP